MKKWKVVLFGLVVSCGFVGMEEGAANSLDSVSSDGTVISDARSIIGLDNRLIVSNTTIPASLVTINEMTSFVIVGNTVTMKGTVMPANTTNKKITWSSSNTNVATVSSTGVVTGKVSGTVTITARTHNGKIATKQLSVAKQFSFPALPGAGTGTGIGITPRG